MRWLEGHIKHRHAGQAADKGEIAIMKVVMGRGCEFGPPVVRIYSRNAAPATSVHFHQDGAGNSLTSTGGRWTRRPGPGLQGWTHPLCTLQTTYVPWDDLKRPRSSPVRGPVQ